MYKHQDFDYEPQHPSLKILDCPACLHQKDDRFEHSAGCPQTGGFMGIGGKWDESSKEFKDWKLFYQYYGHMKRFGGKEGLKVFNFLMSRFKGVCEIPMKDFKKRDVKPLYNPGDDGYPKDANDFLDRIAPS